MFLKKLSVNGFKNIREGELSFSSPLNCFAGDNGAGKTNLLDAVHYLSMGRSAFSMTDNQCVGHEADFFVVEGEYISDSEKKESVVCGCKRGTGKSLKRNGKQYERLSDHVGFIPVVMVSPSDSMLVTDSAEERRRWMDGFFSQLDKRYLNSVIRYRQVLAERNKLLKNNGFADRDVMEVLDMQLAEHGTFIHAMRRDFTEKIAPLVADYYRSLAEDRETVEISYRSDLDDSSFVDVLARSCERDRINQYTTCGIHRDDMKMTIGGYPLRKYGSQGQQKSLLIALKLAQYRVVADEKGEKPILLLDDLFDKLDLGRVGKLIKMVSGGGFGQIFITDHNKQRLVSVLKEADADYTIFEVSEGQITVSP